jgi:hypothetical protein
MIDFRTLNPIQCMVAALFFQHRHLMLILPRQIGKTEFGVRLLHSCMSSTRDTRQTTFMAKSLEAAKRASREKFIRIFPDKDYRVNTETVISKANPASCCYIQSVDREPDRIRGGSFHVVHWSEVAFSKFDKGVTTQYVLDAIIKPTMQATHGYSILESTTNGKNDFYYLWEDAKKLGFHRCRVTLGMMVELGLYSRKAYDELKATTHPDIFAQEYECEWISFSGAVFPEFKARHVAPVAPIQYWQKLVIGIDWGYKDATCVLFAYVRQRKVHVFSEIYAREKTLDEIYILIEERLKEIRPGENEYKRWNCAAVGDHEPDRNVELTRRGIPCSSADKTDFLGSVMEVKEALFKDEIQVDPSCVFLRRDMEAAQWHPKKTNEIDESMCTWGHYDALSAFRYLLRQCRLTESEEPIINPYERTGDILSAAAWQMNQQMMREKPGIILPSNGERDSNGNDVW